MGKVKALQFWCECFRHSLLLRQILSGHFASPKKSPKSSISEGVKICLPEFVVKLTR